MAFADDLLEQAQHLARREPKRPKQASLRRAISTAYYALFHLLTTSAATNWKHVGQRAGLARAFDHRRMREASDKIANRQYRGQNAVVVTRLRVVAKAFTGLQQDRNTADYDGSRQWSRREVLGQIELAASAFENWKAIRKEQIAQDYLLLLLVKDRP
jgi:uncharacterized protein (UPF0332 family)